MTVDATLGQSPDDKRTVAAIQNQIIARIKETLRCASANDQYQNEKVATLTSNDIEVVYAMYGSVRLYLWCRSAGAVVAHRQLYDNGSLKTVLEQWFSDLADTPVAVSQMTERRCELTDQLPRSSSYRPGPGMDSATPSTPEVLTVLVLLQRHFLRCIRT